MQNPPRSSGVNLAGSTHADTPPTPAGEKPGRADLHTASWGICSLCVHGSNTCLTLRGQTGSHETRKAFSDESLYALTMVSLNADGQNCSLCEQQKPHKPQKAKLGKLLRENNLFLAYSDTCCLGLGQQCPRNRSSLCAYTFGCCPSEFGEV